MTAGSTNSECAGLQNSFLAPLRSGQPSSLPTLAWLLTTLAPLPLCLCLLPACRSLRHRSQSWQWGGWASSSSSQTLTAAAAAAAASMAAASSSSHSSSKGLAAASHWSTACLRIVHKRCVHGCDLPPAVGLQGCSHISPGNARSLSHPTTYKPPAACRLHLAVPAGSVVPVCPGGL